MLPLALLATGLLAGCDRQTPADTQPQSSAPATPGDGKEPFNGTLDISSRGAALPDFTFTDPSGRKLRTLDLKGKPLLINLWATWCAPCRREIPLLRQIRAERGAKGVEVVGVAVDFREDVVKYAAEIGLDYPLLIGEEDGMAAADSFGVDPVFPFTAFVDRERRIIALKIGELHADEAAFILDHVDKVNAGSLQPDAARQLIRDEIRRLDALRPKETA